MIAMIALGLLSVAEAQKDWNGFIRYLACLYLHNQGSDLPDDCQASCMNYNAPFCRGFGYGGVVYQHDEMTDGSGTYDYSHR